MQISRINNSPTSVSLKITVFADELEPIKQHVLRHFSDVKVPGFRPGRAPANLVEKHVDQRQLTDEFMEHALNELYRRAIEQEKLRPVGRPKVELKKFVPYTQIEFEVTQDVIGKIVLPDYKKIKLDKPKAEVVAKDVADVIESLRSRIAERKQVSRPAKDGDEAVIDFAGSDLEGRPLEGAEGKDYSLPLGSKTFIPGFEENLIGLKAGDEKEFELTFPKDYGVASLRGQKVKFKVTLKKVNELVKPKADDELAKKAGPFKTLAELKADVKKQLTLERQAQAEREFEDHLVKTIADKSKVEIPQALVEEQLERMEEEEKRNLVYRSQTWQEHLKAEGVTEAQHRERQRPDAEARVKAGLVLSEVSLTEAIDVSPEELDSRIADLKRRYQDPAMQTELDKPENRQDIAARILTEKTLNKIKEYASR